MHGPACYLQARKGMRGRAMLLQSLGYVGIAADKLEDWSAFATGLLGMQVIERGNSGIALRMDDRKQRLLIDRDSRNGCNFFGWEVADARRSMRMPRISSAMASPSRANPARLP